MALSPNSTLSTIFCWPLKLYTCWCRRPSFLSFTQLWFPLEKGTCGAYLKSLAGGQCPGKKTEGQSQSKGSWLWVQWVSTKDRGSPRPREQHESPAHMDRLIWSLEVLTCGTWSTLPGCTCIWILFHSHQNVEGRREHTAWFALMENSHGPQGYLRGVIPYEQCPLSWFSSLGPQRTLCKFSYK